ncbi:MAG: PEP-CTERM sorting domain-containing protein [Bryobacterales bacterium]|nr:PEP-CTERM sorting domain-containing protein [Bryobacterales bacterium]
MTTIDFLPLLGGTGDFTITSGSNSFAGLSPNTGTIKDLDSSSQQVGQPLNEPNFVVLAGLPNMQLTLTFIQPGIFSSAQCAAPPAAGQTCTPIVPGGSPFNLLNNTATSSTATFGILVQALDTNTGEVTTGTGTFTTPFSVPYQSILATLANNGSVEDNPYSATFTLDTIVPEPATVTMGILGLGLIALGAIRRKRA